jgi:hypothetical protein
LTRQDDSESVTRYADRAVAFSVLVLASLGAGAARADCTVLSFRNVRPLVEAFAFRPPQLLREFPNGGDDMIYRVFLLSASSRAAIMPLVNLARTGTQAQRHAIATGLAVAARRCEPSAADHTRRIEMAVRRMPNVEFNSDFQRQFRSAAALAVEERVRQRNDQLRQGFSTPAEPTRPALPSVTREFNRDIQPLPAITTPLR